MRREDFQNLAAKIQPALFIPLSRRKYGKRVGKPPDRAAGGRLNGSQANGER
jgi:hypothetical protein